MRTDENNETLTMESLETEVPSAHRFDQVLKRLKESKQNNKEGGLSPNSSGNPKFISQKIGSWVEWSDPNTYQKW